MHNLVRAFNRLTLLLAGTRFLPLYGVLYHRGRRSKRRYATPVVARRTAHGFVVPLAFGPGADWSRNVQAAGGCQIRWKGALYELGQPGIVDQAEARAAFRPFQRAALGLLHLDQLL